jgi:hypothetical protein
MGSHLLSMDYGLFNVSVPATATRSSVMSPQPSFACWPEGRFTPDRRRSVPRDRVTHRHCRHPPLLFKGQPGGPSLYMAKVWIYYR